MTTLLGIDPGYDRIGWAIGHTAHGQLKLVEYGCIYTDKNLSLIDRYQQIDDQLTTIITRHHPTQVAIESVFFFKNQTTAMHVSEARGVIISACFRQQLAFSEYTPLQIKMAVTGYGRATKLEVDKMIRLQLKLDKEQINDDAMDAIGVLLTHQANAQFQQHIPK